MKASKDFLSVLLLAALGSVAACDRSALSSSQLTTANYDQVSNGMSKSQVETILGQPTTIETRAMSDFRKTTYRYEEGKNFAIVTFKNDEVDGKQTNLGREP